MNFVVEAVTLLMMLQVILASVEHKHKFNPYPRPEDPCNSLLDIIHRICAYDNGTYYDYRGCLQDCDKKTGRPCLLIDERCDFQYKSSCEDKCEGHAWKPICTNRNLTYSNMCEFKRDKRCHYPHLRILHKGQCK